MKGVYAKVKGKPRRKRGSKECLAQGMALLKKQANPYMKLPVEGEYHNRLIITIPDHYLLWLCRQEWFINSQAFRPVYDSITAHLALRNRRKQ